MRLPQNLIHRMKRLAISSNSGLRLKDRYGDFTIERQYNQRTDMPGRRITVFQSMREFFMHPLTWDRNNGYLNVLLALAIFGFCFFHSCKPCTPAKHEETAVQSPKKQ